MNQFSHFLIKITPFYYGWIILLSSGIATIAACAASALTLSVFITPMANELGWSRTLIIGAPTVFLLLAFTSALMKTNGKMGGYKEYASYGESSLNDCPPFILPDPTKNK